MIFSFFPISAFLSGLDLQLNKIIGVCMCLCLEMEGNRWVHTHGMLSSEEEMKETRDQ